MNKNYKEVISKKTNDLSEKIDLLYSMESLIENLTNYCYEKTPVCDENGDYVRDEENNWIVYENKKESKVNDLVDELIEYLLKKYS